MSSEGTIPLEEDCQAESVHISTSRYKLPGSAIFQNQFTNRARLVNQHVGVNLFRGKQKPACPSCQWPVDRFGLGDSTSHRFCNDFPIYFDSSKNGFISQLFFSATSLLATIQIPPRRTMVKSHNKSTQG